MSGCCSEGPVGSLGDKATETFTENVPELTTIETTPAVKEGIEEEKTVKPRHRKKKERKERNSNKCMKAPSCRNSPPNQLFARSCSAK